MLKPLFLSVCVLVALSACGQSESSSNAKTQSPQNATTSAEKGTPKVSEGGEYDAQIDQALKQMQSQLPIKAGDVMEISSMVRSGKSIHYTFTILSDSITPENLGLTRNKNPNAKQLCEEEDTKRFLSAGYDMQFHYLFKNQEKFTLTLNPSDC